MGMFVGLVTLILAASEYGQGYSLDYEYFPHNDVYSVGRARTYEAEDAALQMYDANIHKCECDGNEVWDGTGCSETGYQTYVAVTNLNTNQVIKSPTGAFQVKVGEARCSQDKDVKITLDPNKDIGNQFSLLPNGSLYWGGHRYENYCFDHTVDKKGDLSWEAKVCLPPPIVPRCCHSSSLTSGGSCDTRSAQRYSPPIIVNGLVLQWPGEVPDKNVNVKCKAYENLLSLPLNTRKVNLTYVSGNVSLVWLSAKTGQKTLGEEYCVQPEMEDDYVVSVCYEDQMAIYQSLCSDAICVRKCCPEAEIMNWNYCVPVGNNTELLFDPKFSDANDPESTVKPPENLSWLHGRPQCLQYVLDPDSREDEKFFLLNNGKLFYPHLQETHLPTHYCIDNWHTDGKPHTKALVCFADGPVDNVCNTIKRKVYPALLLVSSFFLGVTLVVYISVPDIRDKLHGRCLISLVAALFVAYTLLATTKLADGKLPKSLCSFLASLTHLSLLAAFFWLNVMCFDIWRTLRQTRIVMDGGRAGRWRYLLYCLYAWGCPLLITVMAIIMDHLPPSHQVIRPNFSAYCWFQDQTSHWVYLYGWVLVLWVANVTFFILVATILCKAQNDPHLTRSREYNRERIWLYAKLFIVMGVTWLAEVVSWQAGACKALIVTDVLNALQGFFLFVVFVCKRTTLKKVRDRNCCSGSDMHRRPSTTMSFSISPFPTSSVFRKRESNPSVSVRSSAHINRPPASPNTRVRNAPSAVPLQTLHEIPDDSSELSHGELQETATMMPKRP